MTNPNLTNEVTAFAKSLEVGLFATRETIEEAYEYAMTITNALPPQERPAVITALHVVLNTVALELRRLAGDDTDLTMLGE